LDWFQGFLLPGYYDDWIVPEQGRIAQLFFEAAHAHARLAEQAGDFGSAIEIAWRAVNFDPLHEEAQADLIRLLAASGQPAAALKQFRELERLLEAELGEAPARSTWQLARTIEQQKVAAPVAPVHTRDTAAAPRVSPSALPTGTVTFLALTCEQVSDSPRPPDEEQDEIFLAARQSRDVSLRRVLHQHGGHIVSDTEHGFLAAFAAASDALACGLVCRYVLEEPQFAAQEAGADNDAPACARMALHTGDVHVSGKSYEDQVPQRVHCLLAAAHEGQTLCSESTAALLRHDLNQGPHLQDLGLYHLVDAALPEHIFQIDRPGGPPAEFPPLRADRAHTGHLPLSFTRFIGRETEIADLTAMLTDVQTRLVTLTGMGGTGKTRLSLEVARGLVEPLCGAVWFVPLADISDAAHLTGAIVDALGVLRSSGADPLDQAVEVLSRQPSLLVLDNFEQIVETGAAVVQAMLERAPSLKLLVTSRQVLGLSVEREVAVSMLPTPHGADAPERLSLCESVRLFIDRAQSVRPDFQVTSHNAPAVAELCDRLEGIPLAVELAAARAQVLTPAQMLLNVERRFDFLVSRKRDVAARHRTLRAAVDWSYYLLSPNLQHFFCRLSVFRGGWTSDAAEAVCDEPLVLDLLAQLRECSFVLVAEVGGVMRFRMLETLRAFASEQLSEEALRETARRHAAYFTDLAEEAEAHLEGPGQTEWYARLEAEHDNFRAALAFCSRDENRLSKATAMRMAASLYWFWLVRGYIGEGRGNLNAALEQDAAAAEANVRARALTGAGILAREQGDAAEARSRFAQSLDLAREQGDLRGITRALNNLGMVALDQGDYEAARLLYSESLELARAHGDRARIAAALNNMANIAFYQMDYVAAKALYGECLELARELQDSQRIATYSLNLGLVARHEGDVVTARGLHAESLNLFLELEDRRAVAYGLEMLATLAAVEQRPTVSVCLSGAAQTLREEIGSALAEVDRQERDARLAALRKQLGRDAYNHAWNKGIVMPLEQATIYALHEGED
jgi:predicted ATPase